MASSSRGSGTTPVAPIGCDVGRIAAYADIYRRLSVEQGATTRYACIHFFVEQLVEISRVLEADLETVVVLALVGQMELQARIRSSVGLEGETPPNAMVGRPPRTNASCIAEVSGIPRETVRRKLERLARRGWVERHPSGSWRIKMDGPDSVPTRREFHDVDRRAMERLSRFLGQMHALAVETQTLSAIDPSAKPSPPGIAHDAD